MRALPRDTRAFLRSGLFRNALGPHCCDFQWLISGRLRFTAVAHLRNDGFQNFHIQFIVLQLQLDYVLVHGSLLFRLQLHIGTLQLAIFVYNCMWHHCSWTTFRLPAF